MKRFNEIQELPQYLQQALQQINNAVIKKIATRIEYLNSVDISTLKNAIEYARLDLKELEKEIAKIKKSNLEDISSYLDEIAKSNIEFGNVYYKAKGLEVIKEVSKHKKLNDLVTAFKKQTTQAYNNISKTTGFKTNNKLKSVRQQYIQLVDFAIISLQTGTTDYNTALRNSLKEMAKTGVKYVEFDTGYNRRLDSQLSMNILEGTRQMSMQMQQIMAEEYGADGYEITAHGLCAPDHQHIQGQQYSRKEYESLNSNLARPIGTLNCKHMAIPILLGVSQPTYTKKELKKITNLSNKKQEYKGKTYTRYEASQQQRKLELRLREQKEILKAYENSNDKVGINVTKKKIKELRQQYKDFSQTMELSLYWERTRI